MSIHRVEYRNMLDSISGNTSRERIEAAVRMLEWSPQQVKSYQQIVYDKGKQSIRCLPLETGKVRCHNDLILSIINRL